MRASCLSDWRGGWVDEGAPAPYAATAAAVRKEIIPTQADSQRQMCGSPRHRSWQWRWRSSDARCPFATPTREQLCARLAGKRIVLYGDSLTHQFFASLASLAGNVTRAPVPRECWRLRHPFSVPIVLAQCDKLCDARHRKREVQHRVGLKADADPQQ